MIFEKAAAFVQLGGDFGASAGTALVANPLWTFKPKSAKYPVSHAFQQQPAKLRQRR